MDIVTIIGAVAGLAALIISIRKARPERENIQASTEKTKAETEKTRADTEFVKASTIETLNKAIQEMQDDIQEAAKENEALRCRIEALEQDNEDLKVQMEEQAAKIIKLGNENKALRDGVRVLVGQLRKHNIEPEWVPEEG